MNYSLESKGVLDVSSLSVTPPLSQTIYKADFSCFGLEKRYCFGFLSSPSISAKRDLSLKGGGVSIIYCYDRSVDDAIRVCTRGMIVWLLFLFFFSLMVDGVLGVPLPLALFWIYVTRVSNCEECWGLKLNKGGVSIL